MAMSNARSTEEKETDLAAIDHVDHLEERGDNLMSDQNRAWLAGTRWLRLERA